MDRIQLFQHIDSILFNDWDPIGVNDIAPDDEYRMYVADICEMFERNENVEIIARHLHKLETENMAMTGNYSKCLIIANKISELNLIL